MRTTHRPTGRVTVTAHTRRAAKALAQELVDDGTLRSTSLRKAVENVPRHIFVPFYYVQDRTGVWQRHDVRDEYDAAALYRNVTLVTDIDGQGRALSFSSEPGLSTRMLDMLELEPGHRVLEIGTGTGYTTALLCELLGDTAVTSIDIAYTEAARVRLRSLGYTPTLVQGDGFHGVPAHHKYDRIISTVAVPHIPAAWIEQLRPGGLLLTDVRRNVTAGNLALLRHEGRGMLVAGRFVPGRAACMQLRRPAGEAVPPSCRVDYEVTAEVRRSHTSLNAPVCREPVPWFLACLSMPTRVTVGMRYGADYTNADTPRAVVLTGSDGSWAEVETDARPNGTRRVVQHGPTLLWEVVESAHALWRAHGRPGWEHLGVSATPTCQHVWLGSPDSDIRWDLPMRV